MTEEQFYEEKIFNKGKINQLKLQFPNLIHLINLWYKSERYNYIQGRKSYLTNKLNQMIEDGEEINLNSEQLYLFFQWWENTPKICHYCSLPQEQLDEIHNQPGHINKRYPKRGKSLEIDRKQSQLPYNNIDNLVFACYWCNNAKTDTFTEEEFLRIGVIMKSIWEERLGISL
jgi:5-methylcytosine-specific restriction endonuclease McrA